MMSSRDIYWMRHALSLAKKAREEGEVPVGAVLVREDKVLGEGWNRSIADHDATAHAEIMAIRSAGHQIRNYRHPGSTLYVTLEPCMMCAGAILHARIKRIVFGTKDPKTGMAGSVCQVFETFSHNHQVDVVSGVLQEECSEILRSFFKEKRELTRSAKN